VVAKLSVSNNTSHALLILSHLSFEQKGLKRL